jgi:hypothetical protein
LSKKWFALWTNWKIGERGFTGYGGQESIDRETSIVALNKTRKDKMIDAYRNVVAAESIQADREAAIRRGDILESKDLEFDYAHNFTARLKYGAKDAIASEIADLRLAAIENFVGLQQTEVATALILRNLSC